jgi:hypothetical protein
MAAGRTAIREIPRVWEVNWAIPKEEGGTPWEAYTWAFEMAEQLDVGEITIVGATYENFRNLDLAIGFAEADLLQRAPHEYEAGGLLVRGVTSRGNWRVRGVVIVAWANDDVLGKVEGQRPSAVAAIAQWADQITAWRSVYRPERIGQVREEQEAEYAEHAGAEVSTLDARATSALNSASAWVNDAHHRLDGEEREALAGALLALHQAGVGVEAVQLRANLMARGWNGDLIEDAVTLAVRVAKGETPHHRHFQL